MWIKITNFLFDMKGIKDNLGKAILYIFRAFILYLCALLFFSWLSFNGSILEKLIYLLFVVTLILIFTADFHEDIARWFKKTKDKDKKLIYTYIKPSPMGISYDMTRIKNQYNARISFLMNSKRSEEEKAKERKQLLFNAATDPRLPNMYYDTEDRAQNRLAVAQKLDAISDNDFLTHPYVLEWSDN